MESTNKMIKQARKAAAERALNKPAKREPIRPVIWEMSAIDALKVNYLTRTNRSIRG